MKTARRIARRSLLRRGLPIEVSAPAGTRVSAVLDTADLARTRGPHGTTDRPRTVKLARRHLRGTGKAEPRRLRLGRTARRHLTGRRGPVAARLLVVAVTSSGRRLSAVRHVRISR